MSEQFTTINRLAKYLRDKVDEFSGEELSDEFCKMVKEIFQNPKYKKMIFKGNHYAGAFINIMRPFRIERIEEALKR